MSENRMMVGGQAVIEGVMMRSPDAVSVACRRKDGRIVVKVDAYRPLTRRWKILNLPLFRGAMVLIESLILGVKALVFSGDIALLDEKAEQGQADDAARVMNKSFWEQARMFLMLAFSLGLGILVFFYIPLLLTDWLGARTGFWFNLIDGIIRLVFFLAYLFLITLMKDIRRVFEYHGAEHKSIFAFENQKPLTAEHAARFSRFHPRCGTSFLLIVMIVSILVFMLLGKPHTVDDRLLRLAFIPVIGGISYELIRLSDKGYRNRFWRLFLLPGLWLQHLTTREPDASQLEVALVALKAALGEDVSGLPGVEVLNGETVLRQVA